MDLANPELDVTSKEWLGEILGSLIEEGREEGSELVRLAAGGRPTREEYEIWAARRIAELETAEIPSWPTASTRVGLGRLFGLSALDVQARLVLESGARLRGRRSEARQLVETTLVLAALAGTWEALDALRAVVSELPSEDEAWRDVAIGAAGRPLRVVGAAFVRSFLDDEHPLLGRSFHRIITRTDTRLAARLTWELSAGTLDVERAEELRAEADGEKRAVIEAIIALVWADGRIDSYERRLVRSLIRMARLPKPETAALNRALAKGKADPTATVAQLPHPVDRVFVLEQVIFAALVDGEVSEPERLLVEKLAADLGIEGEDLDAIQASIVREFDQDPAISRGLGVAGVVDRARKALSRQIEETVRRNLDALVGEIRETGDLVQLLAKAPRGGLTPEERLRAKAQLLDICKTIPALAIFAAPGGTLLFPIVIKILPFSLLPSRFEDQ